MYELTQLVKDFSEVHVALAPIIFIVGRALSVVFAPFPGSAMDLVAIPLFGKVAGFVYAEIAMTIGAIINFYIGRHFGKPFLEKFISLKTIEEWEEKIEKKTGFWGLVGVRMGTISIFDYISYVAGLTKITFKKYILSSVIGSIPPVAIFFYIGSFILDLNAGILTFMIPVIFLVILLRDKLISKKMRSGFVKLFNGEESASKK